MISMCHCEQCQRRTGSAFSVAVFYPRECVAITGPANSYERPSASGFPVRFHFCPRCGANLYWQAARLPELIGVALGGFTDRDFPAPTQSVWMQEKQHWFDLPAGIAGHAQNPVRRA